MAATTTSTKPKLPALHTPVTATFPSELSALSSARTPISATLPVPLSARSIKQEDGLNSSSSSSSSTINNEKTPITPPVAYMEFLKYMSLASPAGSLASPPLTSKTMPPAPSRTSTSTSVSTTGSSTKASTTEEPADTTPPSTASSENTELSCTCGLDHEDLKHKSPTSARAPPPPSPFANYPLSAPPTGPTNFPSLRLPPSPAVDSPAQSPFSARSIHSPFDWDAALKAKRFADAGAKAAGCGGSGCSKKKSVRHIREVVTRTVTYTPRMNPAPKGKRRKVE